MSTLREIDNRINVGEIFSRKQLMEMFKISGQSGIMKTNALNCLVLITSENNGVYADSGIENGTIMYTGEGLRGDQQLNKNNKSIYESKQTGLPMYLFSKDKARNYIFEGKVELCGVPYQITEKDKEGNDRLVWKFPLKIIYSEDVDLNEDDRLQQVANEVARIEEEIEENIEQDTIELKEGTLKIRKYRRTGIRQKRTSKPDYIAEEIIKSKQGIINETTIFKQERKRLLEEGANEQVEKMDEFFENKKENEGFDVLSFEKDENGEYKEKYIEVKSTKENEGTPIDITSNEIEFAKEHVKDYYLYRIVNSNTNQRYLKIVTGEELFSNYSFIPTSLKKDFIGIFRGNEKGFGFVKIEEQEDEIYISRGNTKDAIDGDEVLIKMIEVSREDKHQEGKVLKVLKHNKDTFVGVFQKSRNFGFVVPDDRKVERIVEKRKIIKK